ncbi:high-affinity branched-chain amino acid transport ATP-binding protein LivF [Comamonadaceae bacterium OS-1]|nr:high-affinity branched-chain amino acid transport ATP-binding protein LivF [Comamonadaceae bacterium OS-1]
MSIPASPPLLSTHGLCARYGDFQALFDIDFEIAPGEVVALIGANGAGKSTLLRSLTGLLPVAQYMVRFDGQPVGGSAPHQMLQRGLALVPEGRRLFTGMTVEDNLQVAIDHARVVDAHSTAQPWTLARLYALFPILLQKRRTPVELLSGGQQQMVAIGRGLLSQPRLLLCDELSLGLAPLVIREIYAALPSIAAVGTAIVLVEQDVALACRASHRLYCMLEGRITLTGRSADIARDDIARAYFGASHAVA